MWRGSACGWYCKDIVRHQGSMACLFLIVAVMNHIHVSISRLGNLRRSVIGVPNSILSDVSSAGARAYRASTCGFSFSIRLDYFSYFSRPCKSALRSSHTCHNKSQVWLSICLSHRSPVCFVESMLSSM